MQVLPIWMGYWLGLLLFCFSFFFLLLTYRWGKCECMNVFVIARFTPNKSRMTQSSGNKVLNWIKSCCLFGFSLFHVIITSVSTAEPLPHHPVLLVIPRGPWCSRDGLWLVYKLRIVLNTLHLFYKANFPGCSSASCCKPQIRGTWEWMPSFIFLLCLSFALIPLSQGRSQ